MIEDDDIFVEQFYSTNVADTRYTVNNITFTSETEFRYDFKHITKEGEEFYLRDDPEGENPFSSWQFVPADSVSGNTIKQVQITVQPGLETMSNNSPDYDQTVIKFDYPVAQGPTRFSSHSGVIENKKNIWMHLPRDKYFRILELHPFPFIQAPYEVGNE